MGLISYKTFSKDKTDYPVWLIASSLRDVIPTQSTSDVDIQLPACCGKYTWSLDFAGCSFITEMGVDIGHLDEYIQVYKTNTHMKVYPLSFTVERLKNGNVVPTGTTLALVKYTVFANEDLFRAVICNVLKKYYEGQL